MTDYVAYTRVSTQAQGRSGLGLDAQQAAIQRHLHSGDRLLETFIEVESGTKAARPQLSAAVAECAATGATLLVAKLDRLARDAHFLLGLQKAGVEFLACDMPSANRLTVGIMALVAEEEARAISARTKAALAAAKARGVKLGGDRGVRPAPERAAAARGALTAEAERRAGLILPAVARLRAQGARTLTDLADGLNRMGRRGPRGGRWTATAVRRALLRADPVAARRHQRTSAAETHA